MKENEEKLCNRNSGREGKEEGKVVGADEMGKDESGRVKQGGVNIEVRYRRGREVGR